MPRQLTEEQSEALSLQAEHLADRAAAESGCRDEAFNSLACAEEWVRVYSRNNQVPRAVRDLAIEYLAVMQREGWGVRLDD